MMHDQNAPGIRILGASPETADKLQQREEHRQKF